MIEASEAEANAEIIYASIEQRFSLAPGTIALEIARCLEVDERDREASTVARGLMATLDRQIAAGDPVKLFIMASAMAVMHDRRIAEAVGRFMQAPSED